MLFSNILVPFDGSELASKSLDKAIEMAKLDPAVKVTVLHVVSIPPKRVPDHLYNQVKKAILDDAAETIETVKGKLSEIPNQSEAFIKEGSPYYVIIEQVKDLGCDLIIMGSRGLSGIKEMLGSVSHSITQQSPVPVLLIK